MKKFLLLIYLLSVTFLAFADGLGEVATQDTNEVIKLNKRGFAMRLTAPDQTIDDASKALAIAQKLNYADGIGESYRIMGIGNYYLNQPKKAIDNYLTAINYFIEAKDLLGQANVDNNIGNLYRDNDYDLSLEFLNKSLAIALKLSNRQLMSRLNFNIGNVFFRKQSYYQALSYYNKSYPLFIELKDSVNIVLCLQNIGVIYFNLHMFDKAESLLVQSSQAAKRQDLNEPVASIDLTLASLYIAQDKYDKAEGAIEEGRVYSGMVKDDKLESDFKFTNYQLELKRKNYQQALSYLIDIYKQDSTAHKQNNGTQITIIREQYKQQAQQQENQFLLQRQENDRIKFWGVVVVAGLLSVLVGLLISNVKRKAKTNTQLTDLNEEVIRQKDNLDRINHHLEEIIDDRTKDLQEKNKKLSEYSSYLSHQIRGPIATLKGLMNLEKEGLIDHNDCIMMMNKCVSEIDDKIIEMSDMLHDPEKVGF